MTAFKKLCSAAERLVLGAKRLFEDADRLPNWSISQAQTSPLWRRCESGRRTEFLGHAGLAPSEAALGRARADQMGHFGERILTRPQWATYGPRIHDERSWPVSIT